MIFKRVLSVAAPFLVLAASLSAQWKESFQEERIPLGKPSVASAKAISIARAFLGAVHVSVNSRPTCRLVPRHLTRHAVASSWFIEFDKRYQVSVSAQTGRIMRYADAPFLEKVSKSQMYRNGTATGQEARPEFSTLPSFMLARPGSSLMTANGRPAKVLLQGTYTEWLNDMEVVGEENKVELIFSPRTGKLVLFSRALDLVTGQSMSGSRDKSAVLRVADKYTAKKATAEAPAPFRSYADGMLAYAVLPHPALKQSKYVAQADIAVPCWVVVKKGKMICITPGGKLVGVWSIASQ